jgi:hypothetical protein
MIRNIFSERLSDGVLFEASAKPNEFKRICFSNLENDSLPVIIRIGAEHYSSPSQIARFPSLNDANYLPKSSHSVLKLVNLGGN